jgi:hypothetical protein
MDTWFSQRANPRHHKTLRRHAIDGLRIAIRGCW